MEKDPFHKTNIRADLVQSNNPTERTHKGGSDRRTCTHLCGIDQEEDYTDNHAVTTSQEVNQGVVNTHTDTVGRSVSRGLSLIARRTSSDSSACASSPLGLEEITEDNGPLRCPNVEADASSNEIIDGDDKDGETADSPSLSVEDVLHKLQDAAVLKQFHALANLRDIRQSNLGMLERVNRADPSVKRVLSRSRLTAKEVKDVWIDADIEATVNEFLQTNIVGNFIMVRVLQENYCGFYSWLTAHLQVERNAWAARLKQALEKMDQERRDCLLMKDVLATAASRLQHLIQLCASAMIGASGKGIKDENCPLSPTSLSTNTHVVPDNSLGCSQAGHGQTTDSFISYKDQQSPNKITNVQDNLEARSNSSNRSTNTSPDHSDPTSTSSSSKCVLHACPKPGNTYTQTRDNEVSRPRSCSSTPPMTQTRSCSCTPPSTQTKSCSCTPPSTQTKSCSCTPPSTQTKSCSCTPPSTQTKSCSCTPPSTQTKSCSCTPPSTQTKSCSCTPPSTQTKSCSCTPPMTQTKSCSCTPPSTQTKSCSCTPPMTQTKSCSCTPPSTQTKSCSCTPPMTQTKSCSCTPPMTQTKSCSCTPPRTQSKRGSCCTPQSPTRINIQNDVDPTLEDRICEKCAKVATILGKNEAGSDETDEVDWSQAIRDSVDVLCEVYSEMISDRLACLRLLGVCPSCCSSLLEALSVSIKDGRPNGYGKLRKVEKKCESLEIENRQLVKEVSALYRSLTQKTNEVLHLESQVERLEGELRKHDTRVIVSECLGKGCLGVASQEINRNKRNIYQINKHLINSYQINKHERNNKQLSSRFNGYNNGLQGFSDGLSVVANKPNISGASHEKSNQGADGSGNITSQTHKVGLEDVTKSYDTHCNGRESSSTTSEAPSWSTSGKVFTEIAKKRQIGLKQRASDGSIRSGVDFSGAEVTARRESQTKPSFEMRVTPGSQDSLNQRKLSQDANSGHHKQWHYSPYSDHGYVNSNSLYNQWSAEKLAREDFLLKHASKSKTDVGHCSLWNQSNQQTTKHASLKDNSNTCNSIESLNSATVTKPMVKSIDGSQLSTYDGVCSENNVQCTDILIGRKDINKNMTNHNSSEKLERVTATKSMLKSSTRQQLSNSNGAIHKNNLKFIDIRASTSGDHSDTRTPSTKCVSHSNMTFSSQLAESNPALSGHRQDRKSEVSRCLRCQSLFHSADNHKLACSYHREGLAHVQQHGQEGGKMAQVTTQWTCCRQAGQAGGCCHGRHI